MWGDNMSYCLEQDVYDDIYELCREKGIPIEIRWACFGDTNRFYKDGEPFTVVCSSYYASNIEDVKTLIMTHIESIWECEEAWENLSRSDYAVSIYVMDIIYMHMKDYYCVIIGGTITGGN